MTKVVFVLNIIFLMEKSIAQELISGLLGQRGSLPDIDSILGNLG